MHTAGTDNEAMQGKVVVITGATSGIGRVAAEKLAVMGARVILVARNQGRAEATLARLKQLAPGMAHRVHYADLTRLSEMKRVAGEIAAPEPRIDVLINNAGALFSSRYLTEDGLEMTFALNHVAYFVLTYGLKERLLAASPARVVNTASAAHQIAQLDFDDLQSAKAYRSSLSDWLRFGGPGFKVYGRSKLSNILFTRELARKLQGTGVTANCMHPGFVNTRFGDHSGGLISVGMRAAKLFALSPHQGAKNLIYLASSVEVAHTTGEYFYNCRPRTPARQALDDQAARRLWAETEKVAGEEWK